MIDHTGVTVSDFASSKAFRTAAPGAIGYARLMEFGPEVTGSVAAALAAGGTCNGRPGIRAHCHPNYHAAFVHDPDGRNIEAVCHDPEDHS